MTTQPINHRDQAEQWIENAARDKRPDHSAASALIALTHAILAIDDDVMASEHPAETDDTVEQKLFGLDHIDDTSAGVGSVGEVASRFGSGYGPAPWGAA